MLPHGMLQQWILAYDQPSLLDSALPELALVLNATHCWLFSGLEESEPLAAWPKDSRYDALFNHADLLVKNHMLVQSGILHTLNNQPNLHICRLSGNSTHPRILVWQTPENDSGDSDQSTQVAVLLFFGQLLQKHHDDNLATSERGRRDLQEAMLANQLNDLRNQVNTIRELQQLMSAMMLCREPEELYQLTVEQLRTILPGCRSALMLYDPATGQVQGTFGTDNEGKTADERHIVYNYHDQTSEFNQALRSQDQELVIKDNAPLYTQHTIVGVGWNAMVILRDENGPIAWFALDNLLSQRPLTTAQQVLLITFGRMVSSVLVQMLREKQLRFLHEGLLAMAEADNLLLACKVAVEKITTLGVDRAAILLWDPEQQRLCGTYGCDELGQIRNEQALSVDPYADPVIVPMLTEQDYFKVRRDAPLFNDSHLIGIGWHLSAGLWHCGRFYGAIFADNLLSRRVMTSHQQTILHLFSAVVASLMARFQSEQQLRQLNLSLDNQVQERTQELNEANQRLLELSYHDPLTGLFNRRYFDQAITEWMGQTPAPGLILIDIDAFKAFNDIYGHPAGDECLRSFADGLKAAGRGCIVSRMGGEEFSILIPADLLPQLDILIGELMNLTEQISIPHRGSPFGILTFSAGYAAGEGKNSTELYRTADQALYQAKQRGRHCLVQAGVTRSSNQQNAAHTPRPPALPAPADDSASQPEHALPFASGS
ncbi:MAG: GGDEF domain-containing protein [Plesiomonas sp.]